MVVRSGLLCEWYKVLPLVLFVALTLANDAESPVWDDVVDVAIEQFDPIEPVGVGVVIVVAKANEENKIEDDKESGLLEIYFIIHMKMQCSKYLGHLRAMSWIWAMSWLIAFPDRLYRGEVRHPHFLDTDSF